jgi:hypothetical protein
MDSEGNFVAKAENDESQEQQVDEEKPVEEIDPESLIKDIEAYTEDKDKDQD